MKALWCVVAMGMFGASGAVPTAEAYGVGQDAKKCRSCSGSLDAAGWCTNCNVGFAKGLKTKCRSCLGAIQKNGWCAGCKVGYVNAKRTKCKNCFALMSSAEGGWCADCKVGHAKGLKTKCKKCFAAIKVNGTCVDCKRSFQNGTAYKMVTIDVHDLDRTKVRGILEKLDGVARVRFGGEGSGRVDFDLKEGSKTTLQAVLEALKKAGFHSHEGGH